MWRRSNDTTSMIAGCFLAATGCVQSPYLPRSFAATWHALPQPIGLLLWPACLAGFAVPFLLLALFARLRRPPISWRIVSAALAPGVVLLGYHALWFVLDVYAPTLAIRLPLPTWVRLAVPVSLPVYLGATLLLAVDSLRRTDNLTDRRRIRILVGGIFVGMLGVIGNVAATTGQGLIAPAARQALVVSGSLAFAVLPVSFAYAMLRHRLFDFRVIVRLGLQYAIARGALLAIVPGSVGVLVADVALHSSDSVRQIAVDRAWIYLLLAITAVIAHTQRQRWLTALDRRFFRERSAAQQVLHRIVANVATARRLDIVGRDVLDQIRLALHPRSALLLVRPAMASSFDALAALDGSPAAPALPVHSALVAIVRATRKALIIEPGTSGFRSSLPREDLEWLSATGVELLVPVSSGAATREVLLVLGPRLSEEPYSSEDIELLSAIAASLALADCGDADVNVATQAATSDAVRALRGRYRIERLIGHGGMGTVWEAHDEVLRRAVAIKFLKGPAEPEQLARFKREAQIAAGLAHPNIVVVHDYGVDDDGRPFLVMERLSGETLRRRLRRDLRMGPESAGAVVSGAAAGVGAAHAVKLVHRDLKPENIFLCDAPSSPTVKILDFGLARSLGTDSATAESATGLAGTLRYMAPEQIAGGVPTPSWDIWALGVIAYEVLTGVHPLSSTDPILSASTLITGRPDAVRTHLPEAPASWQLFFERALARDPMQRPQSASDFHQEFARALSASATTH